MTMKRFKLKQRLFNSFFDMSEDHSIEEFWADTWEECCEAEFIKLMKSRHEFHQGFSHLELKDSGLNLSPSLTVMSIHETGVNRPPPQKVLAHMKDGSFWVIGLLWDTQDGKIN